MITNSDSSSRSLRSPAPRFVALLAGTMRNTKIVSTLGPATNSVDTIGALLDAGTGVVRLHFSHGEHEQHAQTIECVRAAAKSCKRLIPIIADLQGPKIRTGPIEGKEALEVVSGQTLRLTTRPGGGAGSLSIDYPFLSEDVQTDDAILIDDGAIELRVTGIEAADVLTEVIAGGTILPRKGVNIPGAALQLPSLTDKDKRDLNFALSQGVDYLALSFVRSAEDVQALRDIVDQPGAHAHVIAKLEKPQALDHLREILDISDGVMVARGDLGVELSPWQVPIEQKRIIDEATRARKPVITATQMLQSMIDRPSPTRAEASDVANAVFDGSDALMLSGETAVGRYPVESVQMMARIIEKAEASSGEFSVRVAAIGDSHGNLSAAVAHSAAELAADLGAKYIVVYSESGYTARLVSKHRPKCPILGLSRHEHVCRKMKLLWGVRSKILPQVADLDALVVATDALMQELGWVQRGDLICVVAGTPFRVPGKTDLIKLHRIDEISA